MENTKDFMERHREMIEGMVKGIDFEGCETIADALHILYLEMDDTIEAFDSKDFDTEDLIESGAITFSIYGLEDTWVFLDYDLVKYNKEDALESQIKNIKVYVG